MLKLLAPLALTLLAGPALAGATDWQEIAPGVKARLVASDSVVDGISHGGLELHMPAGTKTYWRIPGETGIPTEFDFAASVGVANAAVHWPFPQIEQVDGHLDYVYRNAIVLPFEFEVTGEGSVLEAGVTLGLCSDICIPATARFSLPLGKTPDGPQSLRLEQAMATTPVLWDQPEAPLSGVTIGPGGTLYIERPDVRIDPQNFIVDAGDPALLFKPPQKSPDNAIWTLAPLGEADVDALEGRPVQLTFMTPMGPYEVTRTIVSSDPA